MLDHAQLQYASPAPLLALVGTLATRYELLALQDSVSLASASSLTGSPAAGPVPRSCLS